LGVTAPIDPVATTPVGITVTLGEVAITVTVPMAPVATTPVTATVIDPPVDTVTSPIAPVAVIPETV
jgi:hypothetical protein